MFNCTSSEKHQEKEDIIQVVKNKGHNLLVRICNLISMLTLLLIVQSFIFDQGYLKCNHFKVGTRIVMCLVSQIVKKIICKYPHTLEYAVTMIMFAAFVSITERGIRVNPNEFKLPEAMYSVAVMNELLNTTVMTRRKIKNISNCICQLYILIRNYYQYGYLPVDMIAAIILVIFYGDLSAKNINFMLQTMKDLYIAQQKSFTENFQRTLEIIPQGILVIDKQDQQICYANEEIMKLVNQPSLIRGSTNSLQSIKFDLKKFILQEKYSNHTMLNQSEKFKSANSDYQQGIQKYKNNLWKCLVKQNIVVSQINQISEFIFKQKNPKMYLQVRASIINNGEQIIAIMNNITQIKDLESVSQKIRSMFFSSIAHELRTPLNSIIPLSKILQNTINDPQAEKYLKIITNSSLHLQNLIEDSLDMSRIENNKFEVNLEFFDLHQSVKDVAQIMEFQIEQKGLKMIVDIKDRVPLEIKSDSKRYKQVLFNLIGNAVKFTFKGFIKVTVDYENEWLITSVEDTGIGIKQEEINKLFKFFGQISHSKNINKGGMGLGLTISKLILEQLKGEIKVVSTYYQGSTFTFKILVPDYIQSNYEEVKVELYQSKPSKHLLSENKRINSLLLQEGKEDEPAKVDYEVISDSEEENDLLQTRYNNFKTMRSQENSFVKQGFTEILQQESHRQQTQRMNNIKVLIVDDSPYNLFVMKELLTCISDQIQIYTALNGQEALEKIQDKDNLNGIKSAFKLIFMDLNMPVLDGFQTVKQLNKLELEGQLDLTDTEVIALSAITKSQFAKSQDHQLFDSFLEKPVDLYHLRETFFRIL